MRVVRACRACLYTQGVLVRINNTYRRIFESACGIVVSPDDGYPYYFCVECMAQVKKILAFRRKSRRADFVLKEIMTVRNEVSSTDIATVDRKVTNLVSSLDIWKPQNIYLYTYDKTNEEGEDQFVKEDVKYDNGTVKIQCSDIVDNIDDANEEFDDGVEDAAVRENGFDSVDDIIKKLGIDDTTNDIDVKTEEIDLNDVFKGLEELDSDEETKKLDEVKKLEMKENIKNESRRQRMKREREERKKLKEERDRLKIINMRHRSIASRLKNFNIELLSTEKQIEVYEEKMKSEPFKSSLFKCTICVKVFDTVQLLIQHCEEHNKNHGKFSCSICRLRVKNEEDMEIHLSEKHRYKYSCSRCEKITYEFKVAKKHQCEKKTSNSVKYAESENLIDEHFYMMPQSQDDMRAALDSGTESVRCPDCNMGFTLNTMYRLHCEHHIKRPSSKNQCDICGVYYSGIVALTRHMREWHQYLYQCKTCSFETSYRYKALEHIEDHKALDVGCPYCPKKSRSHAGLDFHIRTVHYKETFNKVCPLCGLSFRSYVFYYTHQLEKHKYLYLPHPPQEPNELTCFHCNIEFMSQRAYDTHMFLFGHEEAKDLPYACQPCKKIFENEESKNLHALNCQSTNVFPMPCRICGVNVNNAVEYHYHCKREHPTSFVHTAGKLCEECGKTFAKSTKWSRHFCRVKNKALECKICDLKYISSRSYGLHMLHKHTDYPFYCALCPEKFKRRIKGKEHILKVHTPEMPYTCPVCQRKFAVLKYLNEHASSFHGVDLKEDLKFKTKKIKSHIFIYPHMKLNVSSIDRNKLDKVIIQVRDYNEKVVETVTTDDYEKYLLFDIKPDRNSDKSIDKPEIKRRKRKIKSEKPVKPKKKKVVETVITESGDSLVVFEVDGEKYVTIDGAAYRVEQQ